MRSCLDCPALIPRTRRRCCPCQATHAQALKSEHARRYYQKHRAKIIARVRRYAAQRRAA